MIVVVYRELNSSIKDSIRFFEEWYIKTLINENNVIIVSDVNTYYLEADSKKDIINNFLNRYGLKQIIQEPTRITDKSRTVIDYVVVESQEKRVECHIDSDNKISDHETIVLKLRSENKSKNSTAIRYTKQKMDALLDEIGMNWVFLL